MICHQIVGIGFEMKLQFFPNVVFHPSEVKNALRNDRILDPILILSPFPSGFVRAKRQLHGGCQTVPAICLFLKLLSAGRRQAVILSFTIVL